MTQSSRFPKKSKATRRSPSRHLARRRLQMETLESRRLLDGTGEFFDIDGTPGDDTFEVSYVGSGTNEWVVRRNFATIFSGPLATPTTKLRILGGEGQDSVQVRGTSAADAFQLGSGQIDVNGFAVLGQDVESWRASGEAGNDAFTVLNGYVGRSMVAMGRIS